jgi:hypothetical protein
MLEQAHCTQVKLASKHWCVLPLDLFLLTCGHSTCTVNVYISLNSSHSWEGTGGVQEACEVNGMRA